MWRPPRALIGSPDGSSPGTIVFLTLAAAIAVVATWGDDAGIERDSGQVLPKVSADDWVLPEMSVAEGMEAAATPGYATPPSGPR